MPTHRQPNHDTPSSAQFQEPCSWESHKIFWSKLMIVCTFVLVSMQVLNPKSISLGDSLSSSMMFSNLISRWAIFFSCKYLKTPANSLIIDLQLFSANLWFGCCLSETPNEIPGKYYIMILRWLFVSTTSNIFTIFGWSKLCRIFISLLTVFLRGTSLIFDFS